MVFLRFFFLPGFVWLGWVGLGSWRGPRALCEAWSRACVQFLARVRVGFTGHGGSCASPRCSSAIKMAKRIITFFGVDLLLPLLVGAILTLYHPWLSGIWVVAFWIAVFRKN